MAETQTNTINVVLWNRGDIAYKKDVLFVTSSNDIGIFDILPNHENFVSLIKNSLTVGELGGAKKEFTFNSGILYAKENKINIYLGI